jgi:hypothetical protein
MLDVDLECGRWKVECGMWKVECGRERGGVRNKYKEFILVENYSSTSLD